MGLFKRRPKYAKSGAHRTAVEHRSRIRMTHDGETLTVNEAILRHAGQANSIRNNYNALSDTQSRL